MFGTILLALYEALHLITAVDWGWWWSSVIDMHCRRKHLSRLPERQGLCVMKYDCLLTLLRMRLSNRLCLVLNIIHSSCEGSIGNLTPLLCWSHQNQCSNALEDFIQIHYCQSVPSSDFAATTNSWVRWPFEYNIILICSGRHIISACH